MPAASGSAWVKIGGTAPRCYVDEVGAQSVSPSMTHRPELACGGDEEIARPAPVQMGEMLTAALGGAE